MKTLKIAAIIGVLAAPALAEGDAAAGEKAFRQCKSCHVLDGNDRTGPHLNGVVGRVIGSVDGYRYGDSLASIAETGQVWDEETFVAYVQDPTAWLREETGDARARSKMSFKVRKEQDAYDLYAYLATVE